MCAGANLAQTSTRLTPLQCCHLVFWRHTNWHRWLFCFPLGGVREAQIPLESHTISRRPITNQPTNQQINPPPNQPTNHSPRKSNWMWVYIIQIYTNYSFCSPSPSWSAPCRRILSTSRRRLSYKPWSMATEALPIKLYDYSKLFYPWTDPGGGGPRVRTPLFVLRYRLFNIGPKVGPPPGPPFLLVDLRWTPPPFKNPGSAPVYLFLNAVNFYVARCVPYRPIESQIHSHRVCVAMTLAVAEALNPNKPNLSGVDSGVAGEKISGWDNSVPGKK